MISSKEKVSLNSLRRRAAELFDPEKGTSLQQLRRALYRELDPAARVKRGLSWLNFAISAAIIGAVALAVLETEPEITAGHDRLFNVLEVLFGISFSIEYAARLWTSAENPKYGGGWRGRLRYILTPAALFDAMAIIVSFTTPAGLKPFMLRVVRLLRIFRLAKLSRMTTAMGFLIKAIAARRAELLFSFFVGMFFLLLSATALYFAEGSVQPDKFGSIPRSLWWATATLTTIGYGDVYPITPIGKVLAAISAIAGIGLVAMPTGIMAAAFSDAVQKHLDGKTAATLRERLDAVRAATNAADDLVQQAVRELQPEHNSLVYLTKTYSPEVLAELIHLIDQIQLQELGDFDLVEQVVVLRRLAARAKRVLDKMAREVASKGVRLDHVLSFAATASRITAIQAAFSARVDAFDAIKS